MAIFEIVKSLNFRWLFALLLAVSLILPDIMFECIHLIFEAVEYSLDLLIEHLFHTDLHTTQLIVFYLLLIIALILGYLLFQSLRTWYQELTAELTYFQSQIKQTCKTQWQQGAWLHKVKIGFGLTTLLGLAMLIVFS